jgi:prepilin peptidase CpaA
MTSSFAIPSAVIAISLIACVTDLRTRRIPNVLTLGAAIAGLVAHVVLDGASGALTAGGGWLTGLLIFLPFFALGGMGGGDVKLLAALGAWLGAYETLYLALYSAAAGGALAVVVACSRGYLRVACANILEMLRYWRESGIRPVPNFTLETPNAPRLAYALPMFFGVVVTLWL